MEEPPSKPHCAPTAIVGMLGILLGLVTIRDGFSITIDDFTIKNLPLCIAGLIFLTIGLGFGTLKLTLPQPASPDIHFAYDKD